MARLTVENPDFGALFVVTGPSGAGKSTLIRRVMDRVPGLEFSVSATTRAPRDGEVDGRDYHFLSPEEFARRVEHGSFLEFATVYDRSYGTLRQPVESAIAAGRSVVLDIDVQGARQVKRQFPDCIRVYVLPPRIGVLEQRLRDRGTDEAVIERRMSQAGEQLRGVVDFDYVVVNDDLASSEAIFEGVFCAELARVARRRGAIERVLAELT
jgi:guanylate kinase